MEHMMDKGGDLEEAKMHLEKAKEIVEASGKDWMEFVKECDSGYQDKEDMADESSSDEEMDMGDSGEGNPKKAALIILAEKKKRGMA